jgi:hypothetical protein
MNHLFAPNGNSISPLPGGSISFGEVRRIIGPPQNTMIVQSSGTPAVHRSQWGCGCVADVIAVPADALRTITQWNRCNAHAE